MTRGSRLAVQWRWNDLVTNQTLDLEIDILRQDLRSEMTELRTDLRTEMTELGAGLRTEMSRLGASVDRRLRAQTWLMMSTMIAAVGLSATISRL